MAPLPVARILPRHQFKPPPRPLQTAVSVKGLARLRILVYILLVTSAVFGLAVLLWKFGYFLRYFTLGRILRDRKPVDTRYIKTWYGWIPQDRYNSRRQAWKNLRSAFRRWFSWSDCDDYSQIWWDSRFAAEEKRQINDTSTRRNTDPLGCENSIPWKPDKSAIAPVRAGNGALTNCGFVNISYQLQPRASTYLTFPFCVKSANTGYLYPACSTKNNGKTCQKISSDLNRLLKMAPSTYLLPTGTLSIARPTTHNYRRLKSLRAWATRLQMGSLQSILPHQSGILGRPGSPVSGSYSSSSSAQKGISRESFEMTAASESIFTQLDVSTRGRKVQSRPADLQAFQLSLSCLYNGTDSNFEPKIHKQVEIATKEQDPEQRCSILDVEIRFLDRVDRSLAWFLNECQPGNRGFKFATLQSKLKWLIYTNPCCASTEVMRLYGDRRTMKEPFEVVDSRRRCPAKAKHRRKHIASIDSWRVAINKARRQIEVPNVRSHEFYESSAEEAPESVFNPANWILRRPPRGFPMPTSQKNAYYYGGIERWAKLEDWQAIGGCYNNSNDISNCVSVFAASKAGYSQTQRSGVGISCS
ncbi:hypothetical protein UA08_01263 [Talaromyces atroroseus]|uniref:Uncharacterized protein n=1 Tax=Talaromyces atroroseus TaxID=1441469 RepID=A0A1Q5QCH1_TALAT|nr:hypothetical protein UA08_01263 [Talaromyces atroroseus]OKL63578.1 hypothetical protein UA08_01263 [Talaromyces atroroseus]